MKPTFDVGAVRKECWSSPLVAFPGSTDQWGETIVITVLDLRSLSERNYEYISNNKIADIRKIDIVDDLFCLEFADSRKQHVVQGLVIYSAHNYVKRIPVYM